MNGSDPNPLEREVYVAGAYRKFGGLGAEQARSQAAELAEVGGWGPMAKVAGVALAWRELAEELDRAGAGTTVAELDAEIRERYARRLWMVPPGGSLL